MTNSVTTYLKYANVQMIAQALFDRPDPEGPLGQLQFGNNRSNRFAVVLAEQFVKDWSVVAHQPDTSTGFSGTLFECLVEDPVRCLVEGELVLSLRSTESADDNARDCKAPGELEIQKFGWAFGQIDDMERWYASLWSRGLIDRRIVVTGYSFGGYLATAFSLLRQEQGQCGLISAIYTFNGAGAGHLKPGARLTDLLGAFRAANENQSRSSA